MDELGFNKIAAAVLATALGVMAIREVPHFLIHSEAPAAPVYSVGPIAVASAETDIDLPFPQADWVSAMDAERGAKVFKKCKSCHNVDAGGADGTGPALYGVVGSTAGTHASSFAYSSAMANAGYAWNYEELDGFLTKPSKYLKGTKMSFAGLKKPADRAAVIEYLRVNAANPIPRPEAAAGLEEEIVEAADDVVVNQDGVALDAVIVEPVQDPTDETPAEATDQ